MLFKVVALKIFAIFTGKHLYWNKFMKRRLQRRCFSLNIAESFFYIAPPVAASGCLRCFPSLLFLTFSIFPFRSSQQKCSIKKAVFNLCLITNSYRITCVFPAVLRVFGLSCPRPSYPALGPRSGHYDHVHITFNGLRVI